jgi:predicted nuclease of predicted toxin-antitoxin system
LKLLVDENLSPGLAIHLADLFPGSTHVSTVGLSSTSDIAIWEYAGTNGFVFLTKDKDFVSLSLTFGSPPKVVLLQTGNCFTSQIEHIVRSNAVRFFEFDADAKRSLLLLK